MDGDGGWGMGWGGAGGWMDGLWLCFCVFCGSVWLPMRLTWLWLVANSSARETWVP